MNQISTNLVKYTGVSYPEMGIENGDDLGSVLNKIVKYVLTFTNKKVSLSSPDANEVDIFSAIGLLDHNINNINSDNINFNGGGIFDNGVTATSIPLLNKTNSYTTSINADKLIYSFDLSNLGKDLPSGYNLIYTTTRAYNVNPSKNSLIQDNRSISGTIQISLNSLPVYIETEARFNTPDGDIILKSTNPITSATKGSGSVIFEVQDYTTNKTTKTSVSDWSNTISSKIIALDNLKNQINTFKISGLENIPEQQGLLQCISTLYSFCDSLKGELTSLGTLNIPELGSCAKNTNGTVQEGINNLFKAFKEQETTIKNLKTSNENLKTIVQQVNGYYSDIVNGASGGTLNLAPAPVFDPPCPSGDCGEGSNLVYTRIPPVIISPITFPTFVLKDVSAILVYTEGCASCDQLEDTMSFLHGYYSSGNFKVSIGKINITTYPDFGSTYNVISTPHLILFKNGVKVEEISGYHGYEFIKSKIDSFL
ncbi:MAG: thioredoxin family protein [Saprospiraceae bacterium]